MNWIKFVDFIGTLLSISCWIVEGIMKIYIYEIDRSLNHKEYVEDVSGVKGSLFYTYPNNFCYDYFRFNRMEYFYSYRNLFSLKELNDDEIVKFKRRVEILFEKNI